MCDAGQTSREPSLGLLGKTFLLFSTGFGMMERFKTAATKPLPQRKGPSENSATLRMENQKIKEKLGPDDILDLLHQSMPDLPLELPTSLFWISLVPVTWNNRILTVTVCLPLSPASVRLSRS